MPIASRVQFRTYFDSVALMRMAAELSGRPGVRLASVVMGTPANKEVLAGVGLLDDGASAAGPNDLVVAIDAEACVLEEALGWAEETLAAGKAAHVDGDRPARRPRTLARAAADANLAMISTPGPYAASEALKALHLGLHVFLFSDHVSIEDEVMLKEEASRQGHIVMGPDCGTSVIGGVPLGFANALRPGSVGLAGASGTGLQQVASLVDGWGAGISHMLGVGSRDLSAEVAARSMRVALRLLSADPATEVVVLVSKPPDPTVAGLLLEQAARVPKPVVACFLGATSPSSHGGVEVVGTLEEAARAALRWLSVPAPPEGVGAFPGSVVLPSSGRLLRALYSGGTFAHETRLLVEPQLGAVVEVAPAPVPGRAPRLPDRHLVLDLGADEFTVGRPHPMIDAAVRLEWLRAALQDRSTGVVLVDVVIGYGAANDPAGTLASVLGDRPAGGPLVIAFVVGTEADPQCRSAQERVLAEVGVVVAPSSTAAALLSARLLSETGACS